MKTLLATFLLAVALHAQEKGKPQSTVVFTWSYNYASIPLCTTTVTTNCIHHFTLSEGTTALVAVAATAKLDYNYILTPLPSAGTHTYNLVAVQVRTGTNDVIASTPAKLTLLCRNNHNRQCQVTRTP